MSLEAATNEFVEHAGIRYGYRWIGPREGTPLVCLQHFSGTIDSWDPSVINGLGAGRPVVVFNNAGVGTSSGSVPDSVQKMAEHARHFMAALELEVIDLLGFSLGGMVAQLLAAENSTTIRKVLLVGTAPQGGEEHLMEVLKNARAEQGAPDSRLPLFFTKSPESRRAGLEFLKRAAARISDRDPESGQEVMQQQAKALIGWCASKDPEHKVLRSIRQPVLIAGGSHDTMLPSRNAYEMFANLSNAQLVLYPDSGHGSIFQCPLRFVKHARIFLEE